MDSNGIIVPVLGVLLPIIITLGAFVMIVYLRKFDNIERMSIIDKGLSPDMFKRERGSSAALRWSFLLVGVGVGFLMGYWLDRSFDMEQVGYFAMLFIFGGLGLGLGHLMEERRNRKA